MSGRSFTVTLDRPRTLRISVETLAKFKRASGIDLWRGQSIGGPRVFRNTVLLVHALLADDGPPLREQDVAEYVTAELMQDIAQKLAAFLTKSSTARPHGQN